MASISSVQFHHSVVSDSLQPHGLQHDRLPCPSPTPEVYSNPCPLSWWCHPTISSSVIPLSSCLHSLTITQIFKSILVPSSNLWTLILVLSLWIQESCVFDTFQSIAVSNAFFNSKCCLDGPRVHTKQSKSEKEKPNILWYHLYVESEVWHKWTYLWDRNRLTDIENIFVLLGGSSEGYWKFLINPIYRVDKQQVLFYSTGFDTL